MVTNSPKAARDFVSGRDGIAKSVVNGGLTEGDRRYAIYTTPVTSDDLADEAVRAAPIIFQERIANAFDLRVTVVGTRVFATRIFVRDRDGEADWRSVDPSRITYEPHRLPSRLEAGCIALVKAFALSFAALDFIVTPQGEHVFLELNPSGQWGWLEEATGTPVTDAIVNQLIEGAP
jgi:glutathione synthase/RimK-type ligase-like ATP-grasp enzyme